MGEISTRRFMVEKKIVTLGDGDGSSSVVLQLPISETWENIQHLTAVGEALARAIRHLEEQMASAASASAEDVRVPTEKLAENTRQLSRATSEVDSLTGRLKTSLELLEAASLELDSKNRELALQYEESNLARSELEAVFASMDDALVVIDSSGELLQSNPAYVQLEAEQLVSPLRDARGSLLADSDRPERHAAGGEAFEMDVMMIDEKGDRRWFEVQGYPVADISQGQRVVVVYHEVTQTRMRVIQEEFADMASHELRTPLTSIQGHIQLVLRGFDRDAPRDNAIASLNIALRQTRHLASLIDDLMDKARVRSGRLRLQLEPVDVAAIVERVVTESQVASPVPPVEYQSSGETVDVLADISRIHDVVEHLLSNARKPASSTEPISVDVLSDAEGVTVSVTDRGPGVPEDALTKIFSSGYQVDGDSAQRGRGLGLAIAKDVIDAHGGTIKADSVEGSGTAFTIWLPAASQAGFHREPVEG